MARRAVARHRGSGLKAGRKSRPDVPEATPCPPFALVRVMNVRGARRPRVTGDVSEEVKRRPFRDAAIR